jgi:hypothetical protein
MRTVSRRCWAIEAGAWTDASSLRANRDLLSRLPPRLTSFFPGSVCFVPGYVLRVRVFSSFPCFPLQCGHTAVITPLIDVTPFQDASASIADGIRPRPNGRPDQRPRRQNLDFSEISGSNWCLSEATRQALLAPSPGLAPARKSCWRVGVTPYVGRFGCRKRSAAFQGPMSLDRHTVSPLAMTVLMKST